MIYKELNDMKIRALVMLIIFFISLLITIVLRPYTETMFDQMVSEFEKLPEFMKKIIGDPKQFMRLKNDEFYLLNQWHGKNLGQFLPLLSLLIAFPIFSRENEKKTIYFLLSRKRRLEIFWAKFIVGLTITLSITILMSTLGFILMRVLGYSVSFRYLPSCLLNEIIGVSFFFSLFLLFSIISNDQVKPVIIGIGILIGLPILGIVETLSFLNPYPYVLCIRIIDKGIDLSYTFGLLFATFVLTSVDYILFKNREF